MSSVSGPDSTSQPNYTPPASGSTAGLDPNFGPQPQGDEGDEQVSTMKDLQDKHPDLYKTFLKTLANNIINDMKKDNDRFKEAIRNNSSQ